MSSQQISNMAEYTVTEISGSIKKTVETAFTHVRVRGEISGFRGQHSSGHAYFSIKDQKARMDAVVWKGVFNRLKFKPEEGMEMIRKAVELRPRSGFIVDSLGWAHYRLGNYEEAVIQLERAVQLMHQFILFSNCTKSKRFV